MKQMKHWQDPVNAVLGVWLILSPWALGFQAERTPMVNAVIIGLLLLAAALGAIFVPRAWEEWTEGVLGLWLAVSPWALQFSGLQSARVAAVATGIVVIALALWVLATDKEYTSWSSDRTAH
jgi:heme/copper-type cytochrome/quinol oxidase subunit 3